MHARYYQESDYEGIVELANHIWDGQDYLPRMIQKYHNDPNSHPILVEIDDTVVAFGNMRLLSDSIAWLEAIRTHPDYRGRGLSKLISDKHFEIAENLHVQHFWLFTSKDNVITRNLLAKYGFHELFTTKLWHSKQPFQQSSAHMNWQVCTDLTQLSTIASKLSFQVVLGEFKVLPIDSYEVPRWLANGEVYIVSTGIMSIRKSLESDSLLIIGINTDDPNVVNAGMNFAVNMIHSDPHLAEKSLKLFYPANLTTNFPTERVFRVMEYTF